MKKTYPLIITFQILTILFIIPAITGADPISNQAAVSEFNASIVTIPDQLTANHSFQVIVKGTFPSTGYEITDCQIMILESYPEQIHMQLEIVNTGDSQNLAGAFEYMAGVLKFGAGQRSVRGSINGEPFYEGVFDIQGDDVMADPRPFLIFDRSGGFAGISQRLFIDGNGGFLIEGTPPFTVNTPFGRIAREQFVPIVDQAFAADFPTLQKNYPSPTQIADGFYHVLTFDGISVNLEPFAELPPELDTLFNSLSQIMDGDIIIAKEAVSSVEEWEMY